MLLASLAGLHLKELRLRRVESRREVRRRNRFCFRFVDAQKPLLKDEHHFKHPENVAARLSSMIQYFFPKKGWRRCIAPELCVKCSFNPRGCTSRFSCAGSQNGKERAPKPLEVPGRPRTPDNTQDFYRASGEDLRGPIAALNAFPDFGHFPKKLFHFV